MTYENFIEYLKERKTINQYEAENRYRILKDYIFVSFDFVKRNKSEAFFEYLYRFILEDMEYEEKNDEHGPEFCRMYDNIKERINLPIDELKSREVVDFDYENEVLVIAFRILKYFEWDENNKRLFLRWDRNTIPEVRVYNDYKSNVFTFVITQGNIDYASLKIVEKRIDSLKKEIEYLNDFVLNYYQEHFLDIFRITKIVFDKEDITNKFIQGEVKFTASFEIIQKLIGPLYLNRESYGIRELIQNAVDACAKKDNHDGKINIKYIEGDNPQIIIKDNGIGMNEEIIVNKFLTIGESTKNEGNSIGKFGIGILAAFLLADKMKFKTCYNAGEYLYESEPIELDAVKNKDKFINIKIVENEDNFQGTEIALELKKNIIENDKIIKICDGVKYNTKELLVNFLGIKNNYGNIWYGYSEQLKKFHDAICSKANENNIQFAITEDDIRFDKDEKLKFYEDIVADVGDFVNQELIELDEDEKFELKKRLEDCCKKLSNNIKQLWHLKAYAVFTYLQANKWFLNRDNSTDITFYDKADKLESIHNIDVDEIEDKEKREYKLENIDKLYISYIWSKEKEFQGNVFCNSMLIPAKYQYETSLSKVFNILPTILVDEKTESKIEIDLARENCKLKVNDKNYEEQILSYILRDCLLDLKSNAKYLQNISWLYFVDIDGKIKKIIKNKFWLDKHIKQKYFMVFLKTQEEAEEDENYKINIVKQMRNDYGYNIMIEFVEDYLHIETYFNSIEDNDLYIAAKFEAVLIIGNGEQEIIKKFSVYHLRALAIAAKNIFGNVDVYTNNQLKLNTEILKIYRDNSEYEKLFKIWDNNQKVYCLNYRGENIGELHELPDNVNAIMEVKFDEYNDYCNFYKQISTFSKKRNCVWNGFQEGISGMQQLESELEELFLKEYEV